ncbi:hypothetical protein J3Q64DRAFT_1866464 [Phycomyces blakesleeanus]|uniref:C2H2-type domain-containing protein n=2 Tax=Phycomyces blakesleeanus TaxID=4837 RepID=A0A162QAA3_PHYB8|nr:hypothetical protein PHYBLDRAFT_71306 [Phycomyces blakesleeanus NRRL 1555(-)]OAD81386.1 hypothetical protein PHYBLDRAFT_71306 [Phycomyces blakesleeanus NRRL 1555(-)]|eukprot:XP_018299426.1 hypothetical protein PHYBLDRAFT_71306 [Phycomyces blakesleeanus NRRL 1555(-)]
MSSINASPATYSFLEDNTFCSFSLQPQTVNNIGSLALNNTQPSSAFNHLNSGYLGLLESESTPIEQDIEQITLYNTFSMGHYLSTDTNVINTQVEPLSSHIAPIGVQAPPYSLSTSSPFWNLPMLFTSQGQSITLPLLYNTTYSFPPRIDPIPYPQQPPIIPENLQSSNNNNINHNCNQKQNTSDVKLQIIQYNVFPSPTLLHDPNSRKTTKMNTYSKRYICKECGYWSDRKSNVDRHFLKHLPNWKKHKCPVCKNRFSTKFNLKRHMLCTKKCKIDQPQ